MLEELWPSIQSIWPYLTREEHELVLEQIAERRHAEEQRREEEEWDRALARARRESDPLVFFPAAARAR